MDLSSLPDRGKNFGSSLPDRGDFFGSEIFGGGSKGYISLPLVAHVFLRGVKRKNF